MVAMEEGLALMQNNYSHPLYLQYTNAFPCLHHSLDRLARAGLAARPPTRPPPLLPFPPHPSLATMGVKVVPLIRSPRPLSRSRRSFPTPTPTAEQGAAAMATHDASCDAGHINEDSFTWVLDKRYPRNNPLV